MRKYGSLLLLLAVIATSCYKKPQPFCGGCGSPAVAPGVVMVNMRNTTPIESVFALFDSTNLEIKKISGYGYTSSLSVDSTGAVGNYLRSRSYIDSTSGVVMVNSIGGYQINVVCNFSGMNLSNQQDWLTLKSKLMFTDDRHQNKIITLKVPDGLEQFWATKLTTNPLVIQANVIMISL